MYCMLKQVAVNTRKYRLRQVAVSSQSAHLLSWRQSSCEPSHRQSPTSTAVPRGSVSVAHCQCTLPRRPIWRHVCGGKKREGINFEEISLNGYSVFKHELGRRAKLSIKIRECFSNPKMSVIINHCSEAQQPNIFLTPYNLSQFWS